MERRFNQALALLGVSTLVACATTGFSSTWRNPEAQPLQVQGSRVAALVMHENEASRREAEDVLAREITARGAEGVPMYTVLPGANVDEAQARAALEQAGFAGIVVMRPVGTEQQITGTPTMYMGPRYAGFWGGYYGYGWGAPYGTDIRTDTIVSIETLVYSLSQNRLVWGGQSRTTNPSDVDALVREVAAAVAGELADEGLIGPS